MERPRQSGRVVTVHPLSNTEDFALFRAEPPGVVILDPFSYMVFSEVDGSDLDTLSKRVVERMKASPIQPEDVIRSLSSALKSLSDLGLVSL